MDLDIDLCGGILAVIIAAAIQLTLMLKDRSKMLSAPLSTWKANFC